MAGGRKLSDDVISTQLQVLMDDDLPASLGGGPNLPLIITQNVKDDNGLNLKDGSVNPPPPARNGRGRNRHCPRLRLPLRRSAPGRS